MKNFFCNRTYKSSDDFEIAFKLYQEYADSVGVNLCFYDFGQELRFLPCKNAALQLRILLACYKSVSVCQASLRPGRY